jgi:hypothetical protein
VIPDQFEYSKNLAEISLNIINLEKRLISVELLLEKIERPETEISQSKVIWEKTGYIPKAVYEWSTNNQRNLEVVGICPTHEKVDETDVKVQLLCLRVE